tara:strand:- start:108 stop:398 length:291 start_codon:yes stop_codon:yes gene_type:complete
VEDTEEMFLDVQAIVGVLVALVVEQEAQALMPLVEQEILLLKLLHKEKMVVMHHILVLQIMELVGVVELLKKGLMVLLLLVAEEVQVQQLVFQQVL